MDHNFNVAVAEKVGLNSAVIFNSIYYWIEKNKADERNYKDGYYWTFMSKKGYCRYFPYLTERQIDYALKKLVDEGYLVTGNYNKSAYDRTLWYRITDKGYAILQNCEIENANFADENNKNVEPIPNINTSTKKKESKKVEDRRSYENIINSLVDDPKVREALQAYLQMRIMQKKAPSNNALILLVERLKELSQKPDEQVAIINQSTRGGYTDFYELKKQKASRGKGKTEKPKREAISKPIDYSGYWKNEDGTYDLSRYKDGRAVKTF